MELFPLNRRLLFAGPFVTLELSSILIRNDDLHH